MARRIHALAVTDFTGGLNLSGDPFQLAENESPDMLNVEIDARGGLRSREGWIRTSGTAINVTPWAPKMLRRFYSSSGNRFVLLCNSTKVLWSSDGASWTVMTHSGGDIATTAVHGSSFIPWNTALYVVPGASATASYKWTGANPATALTVSGSGSPAAWQNDYSAPVGGHMPKANFAAAHAGYAFVASTNEAGTAYVNRVRWSHPNSPENWAAADFIDILDGGDGITALVPFGDNLLIFKRTSVWALYGNDADTWQLVNVTRQLGVSHQTMVARSEDAVWFFDWPQGLFRYSASDGIRDLFVPLRSMLSDGAVNAAAVKDGKVFVNFINRRLWLSLPYSTTNAATEVTRSFVYDPVVGVGGAWVVHQSADGYGIGSGVDFLSSTDQRVTLAVHPTQKYVLQVEKEDQASDAVTAATEPFTSFIRTGWLTAAVPTQKKLWRRPDFVTKRQAVAQTLSVEVFKDFDQRSPAKSFQFGVDTTGGGAWGTGTWGTGVWGSAGDANDIDRGAMLGQAKAVQLRVSGTAGVPWGLNAVVFKFIYRRLR